MHRSSSLLCCALILGLHSLPAAHAGAPLKGVDVKLGKNPGGRPAARVTDSSGKADFGVVAAGSYTISVVLPSGLSNGAKIIVTGPKLIATAKAVAATKPNSRSVATEMPLRVGVASRVVIAVESP